MNARMIAELAEYFGARVHDTQTRVIVLRATGKAFCAGLDLREMTGLIEELDTAARLRFQQRLSSIFVSMRRCPQPIVCLVQGAASGGGFALALASDIRLCTPEARMNAAFIKVGLSGCDVGMSYLLPRAVGTSVAAEMLLTGSFLDATRAAALGFVSAVVPTADLEAAGAKTVAVAAAGGPARPGAHEAGPAGRYRRAGHRVGGRQRRPAAVAAEWHRGLSRPDAGIPEPEVSRPSAGSGPAAQLGQAAKQETGSPHGAADIDFDSRQASGERRERDAAFEPRELLPDAVVDAAAE